DVCSSDLVSCRVAVHDWIGIGIQVFMQTYRVKYGALVWIHRNKCPGRWFHVSCSKVIETGISVILFSTEEKIVPGIACSVNQVTKGIVGIGVCYYAFFISQLANGTMSVIEVIAGFFCAMQAD